MRKGIYGLKVYKIYNQEHFCNRVYPSPILARKVLRARASSQAQTENAVPEIGSRQYMDVLPLQYKCVDFSWICDYVMSTFLEPPVHLKGKELDTPLVFGCFDVLLSLPTQIINISVTIIVGR
ncbi:hypothetical protein J6590_063467 [Homalodisca vitripennis]|nr:hypothetical protein J6590_063467 [Homalodisca vitripennis]